MSGVPPLGESDSRVIAAFPATGKSWMAARDPLIVDSDSSAFSRKADWPDNYMAHIRAILRLSEHSPILTVPAVSAILVSTHAEVREALAKQGIPFTLVYPSPDQRDEYRERMERRGSSEPLIRKVIDELWDDALADCAAQAGCDHIVLGSGQYLADVWEARRAA